MIHELTAEQRSARAKRKGEQLVLLQNLRSVAVAATENYAGKARLDQADTRAWNGLVKLIQKTDALAAVIRGSELRGKSAPKPPSQAYADFDWS
jgi:hypothetical protein